MPQSATNGPRLQIPEFSFLTTHPFPALPFHAYQEGYQSVMRAPTQSHAIKEDASAALNKYLDCLGLPPGQERKNIGDRCLNNIFSQEGVSDIFNHPGCGSGRKFCALVVAFGLLTRQVGNRLTPIPALVKASIYCMATGDQKRWMLALVSFYVLREMDDQLLVTDKRLWVLKGGRNHQFRCFLTLYRRLTDEATAWDLQNPGSVRRFGKKFWQHVGCMMLSVPEADDFDTQVGLMYFVLMVVQVLCLQEMSEHRSHLLSQAPLVRCLLWLTFAKNLYPVVFFG